MLQLVDVVHAVVGLRLLPLGLPNHVSHLRNLLHVSTYEVLVYVLAVLWVDVFGPRYDVAKGDVVAQTLQQIDDQRGFAALGRTVDDSRATNQSLGLEIV